MTEGTTMASMKICTAIISGALLLIGLGGCSQASAAAGELTGAPVATATSSVSLAPQAQDMPGAPIPSASSASTETVTVVTAEAPAPAATGAAPGTVKATTKATVKATTKAAAPKTTVPAAPKTTTAPVNTYKPPSTAGILTLTCTWNGAEVVGHASWSGPTGIFITVTVPGMSATTSALAWGNTAHGSAGVHGACSASGGGQSKSASA